ncbi:aromatic-ring-hydroxylating dioxygenase subunit beta [Sphingopyxis sp. GW247-27LB]|uniref:aromatic-ring-hydroxylating dioxygenase subunit beta n=1 Tax=Sphingopyxis sp. GW247-27LB TaxID=2012632 RepID=UPI000BA656EB|nr:aromatic-ring-hydroxylating dioxygenase subunit beta [Sphingopyxis sp. GW247-27LB]PAL24240.1 aromatic-ring-hydroxylating dioxygenase subunit beta [Sphingopyxis sp. GW247-27LB]
MSIAIETRAPVEAALPSRAECEEFLIEEAALLNEGRFTKWYDLFLEGATYEVPQAGSPDEADSAEDLFYIADSYSRLGHRVARMTKKGHHSEWPASVCSRLIGNVRIVAKDDDGAHVESRFITHRSKNDVMDVFVGHHRYVLRVVDGNIRIAEKRSILDMNSLRPQGRVSIIV